MDIVFAGSLPFEGGSRRPQQMARGLAARGHRVLYIDPPHPFGAQIDPSRFAPEQAGGVAEPVPAEAARRLPATWPGEGLVIMPSPAASMRPGRWGWDSRSGWKLWASETAALLAGGFGAGAGAGDKAAGVLVDHPALLGPVRAASRAPLVFDCVEDFAALAPSRTLAAAFEEALEQGVPGVDGLVVVNRYLLESWERRLHSNAVHGVIEQGVDLALFRPADAAARTAARRRLALAENARVAIYLGRFDARVSFEDLERILERDSQLRLVLLGEVGSEGESILQRLPRERVDARGAIRQSEAASLLPAADVLLIPFRSEPQFEAIRGLKLYEYFATGLPVVAYFRRGMKAFRELVYLYTTWEEMEEALRHALSELPNAPARRVRIAAAEEASWERRVGELEAFLVQVMSRRA
jgi:glycosyltransferase involved in cell wall biosynthesis